MNYSHCHSKAKIEHQAVLLAEAIQALAIDKSGIYIDATFGFGGHSQDILSHLGKRGRLLAIDRDAKAVAKGKALAKHDQRFTMIKAPFSELLQIAKQQNVLGRAQGVLADLGLSSIQLDDASRGFSFTQDGPLDMRMDNNTGVDAATWLATANKKQIADVLWQYGEERYSRRIASLITEVRGKQAITRTKQLVDIIQRAIPRKTPHKHPATRTFQAIRIFINKELDEIQQLLDACLDVLKVGGRLVVISFHSLEDRLVKRFIQRHTRNGERMQRVGRFLRPTQTEITGNPRARSAIMRIAEKVS